jgi:putative restriction endonuclease
MREGTMNVQGTYISKLQNLHRDSIPGRWSDLTLNKAPHKPLLLLCISDLYRQDPHRSNRVEPTLYLEEAFDAYWRQLFGNNNTSTFALPFFHLQYDGFWSLISTNGGDVEDPMIAKTPRTLRSAVAYAIVDSELHELFKKPEWNQHLRSVIIASNFAPEAHYRFVAS